jgi:hypothetical protein
MRPVLISLIIVMMFVVGSCGDDKNENSIPVGSLGFPCIDIGDGVCVDDLVCEDGICVVDESGNTGDTGDTGDTGNTGNSGNTVDTGNACDTGNTGDNFPNEHNGLYWSDVLDTSDGGSWGDAVGCCKILGGRLPTISELRTLIQNCPGTETGGECGVTDDCLSLGDCRNYACGGCEEDKFGKYSVFGDTGWFLSSSRQSDNDFYVWYVNFKNGVVCSTYLQPTYFPVFRCVR